MLVYHGTSLAKWKRIKKTGLLPRISGVSSNWKHSVESDPHTVYLTDAYALYFSLQCVKSIKDKYDHAVIIEIDTDKLDQGKLVADEDALEQIARRFPDDGLPSDLSMEERTKHYRSMTEKYAVEGFGFDWSMKALGTCGHKGRISPSAFTRVAIIDIKKQAALAWIFMDAQVSVMNYRYVGAKYRAYTNMIFGEKIADEDLAVLNELQSLCVEKPVIERDGLEIIKVNV